MTDAIERARGLRRKNTNAEAVLWHRLRNRGLGVKFRRQVPVGDYVADFLCVELKLIVEVDGGQHNESKSDEKRTQYLNSLGYEVVRFWNNDILANTDGALSTLALILSQRAAISTSPAPRYG